MYSFKFFIKCRWMVLTWDQIHFPSELKCKVPLECCGFDIRWYAVTAGVWKELGLLTFEANSLNLGIE